jgi:hypothetical protein
VDELEALKLFLSDLGWTIGSDGPDYVFIISKDHITGSVILPSETYRVGVKDGCLVAKDAIWGDWGDWGEWRRKTFEVQLADPRCLDKLEEFLRG